MYHNLSSYDRFSSLPEIKSNTTLTIEELDEFLSQMVNCAEDQIWNISSIMNFLDENPVKSKLQNIRFERLNKQVSEDTHFLFCNSYTIIN